MGEIRPYVLADTNYLTVKDTQYDLAVLPWGATEAHNYHMPYGTDNILAESVAIGSAAAAWKMGSRPLVLPTIPFGVNTGQFDVDLCMNMHPSTQLAVLRDIVQVLNIHGIPKLVILNAHGGNEFKPLIRELYTEYPDVFICSADWWKVMPAQEYFDEPGDHAGELETSVVMHLREDLVLPLEMAGDGRARTFSVKGLRQGWVKSQRKWSEVSRDTGVGDPKHSNSEKGERFFNDCVEELGRFFFELGTISNDELYTDL